MKKRILSFVLAIVLILVLVPGAFATSNPWSSNDAPSSWAQSYVREAYNQNLVPSNLMGRFTQSITRAEFTHLAVALYEELTGRTITGRVTFTDTDDVNVQKMAYLGVVRGVGNNRFNPDGLITREESAAMLVRLANATDVTIPDYSNYTFADHDRVSSWAVGYVRQMRLSGIMGGVGNNRFDPMGRYTIEQSITTMLRTYDHVKFVHSIPDYITIAGVRIPTTADSVSINGSNGTIWFHEGRVGSANQFRGQITNECLAPLKQLPYLQRVILQVIREITDITPLVEIRNLRTLDLAYMDNVDITPLSRMMNLRELSIGFSPITDLSPIAGLHNLESLAIHDTQISDLSLIAGLTNLRSLSLYRNQLRDLTPIAGLMNLEFLFIERNQSSDLTPLAGLTNLTQLFVTHSNITDITPLARLTNLVTLILWHNQISDLTPLASLYNLERLNLQNNRISDLTPLAGLMHFDPPRPHVWIQLFDNPITDWSPVSHVDDVRGRP